MLLTYTPQEVRAEITNTSASTNDSQGLDRPQGQGLTGMRERAALYDGTLESGPLPTGGWLVRLRIPREGSPS